MEGAAEGGMLLGGGCEPLFFGMVGFGLPGLPEVDVGETSTAFQDNTHSYTYM